MYCIRIEPSACVILQDAIWGLSDKLESPKGGLDAVEGFLIYVFFGADAHLHIWAFCVCANLRRCTNIPLCGSIDRPASTIE